MIPKTLYYPSEIEILEKTPALASPQFDFAALHMLDFKDLEPRHSKKTKNHTRELLANQDPSLVPRRLDSFCDPEIELLDLSQKTPALVSPQFDSVTLHVLDIEMIWNLDTTEGQNIHPCLACEPGPLSCNSKS